MTIDRFKRGRELMDKIKEINDLIDHYEYIKNNNFVRMKITTFTGISEIVNEVEIPDDIQIEIIEMLKKKLAIYKAEFDAL